MRICPITNNIKQNNKSKLTIINFSGKTPKDFPKQVGGYIPQKRFSPLRQSIESLYGQKLARLNNLAATTNMPEHEFNILKNKIIKAKTIEIANLKKSSFDF